jgi:aspartate kinase
MKVFKFGGASLKNADGVKNVASIIRQHGPDKLLVVVSAMGKSTNALEKIHSLAISGQNSSSQITILNDYHQEILKQLFPAGHEVYIAVETLFQELRTQISGSGEFDMVYDQVVSIGEMISSVIVHHYLTSIGLHSHWLDARTCITTDKNFREGKVDWIKTSAKIQALKPVLEKNIIITQGFIGSTEDGYTTTLGREGSDFSAAIFASSLLASSVTIWKDVPGVMNADPKRLSAATVFEELPFQEAAEMTYYGANVIHPKTIKPLANKGIPLLVKNFEDPSLPGTKIHECKVYDLPPLIVFKDNQCLISCKVTDYTFVTEQHLSIIFNALSSLDLRVNVMQNSAISFSFCLDFREHKVLSLIQKLQEHFEVYYNTGLTLITVKNYDEKTFEMYRSHAGVLLEQSSRSTLQVLVRL